jgi:hypothetical protein
MRVSVSAPPHPGQFLGSGTSIVSSTCVGGCRCPYRPWHRPARRPGASGCGVGAPFENGAAWRLPARRAASKARVRRSFLRRNCLLHVEDDRKLLGPLGVCQFRMPRGIACPNVQAVEQTAHSNSGSRRRPGIDRRSMYSNRRAALKKGSVSNVPVRSPLPPFLRVLPFPLSPPFRSLRPLRRPQPTQLSTR